MKRLLGLLVSGALIIGGAGATFAQQDTKGAIKEGAKDVGHGTKKVAKGTGKAVKKVTKKVVHKGAKVTKKGAEKVEGKTDNKK